MAETRVRFAVLVGVALLGLVFWAGPAQATVAPAAAPAPAKKASMLTITKSRSITPGTSLRILTHLRVKASTKPIANTKVTLLYSHAQNGPFHGLKDARTSSNGGTSVGVRPSRTTWFIWKFAGNAKYAGARSVKIKITVTKPAPSPAPQNCTPGYSPCIPPGPDVDCAGGSGNGPRYVTGPIYVTGSDPYGLDRDGNGVGCQ
ncbi:hypothetical protein M6D93_03990 [Jatrophihabitans telluris]|uniref:Excalibur calcium-binding domain-containing protein n=1 Tax=Jatrophihabitans telluris TaxID=2038343 RepID=A0ABY4R0D3_9ACTN|nr:hypothetical protein [Jatrophihabitans telluris]UQX89170.1 hypothetical protein M6D93_03990 [Jatrophihabitans telluris]